MVKAVCWVACLFVGGCFATTERVEQDGHSEHSHMAASAEQKIRVDGGTFRAPIPGMENSVGYMTITNLSSDDLVLVGAKSDAAKRVEFHDHVMENGVMKMFKVQQLELLANQSLKFQSGGLHLMFIELNQIDHQQESIIVELLTDKEEVIPIVLKVNSVHQHHSHHH
ncbi:MAG: copper chaperone PCu(A)C [Gammaproteobacteria bacterium]|nr:copper chaperone PCu(A)C [Gammaproteobacteria bacterium]